MRQITHQWDIWLTNEADDAGPADQVGDDVGEVGEHEYGQHLQGLHPPAQQRAGLQTEFRIPNKIYSQHKDK